LSLIKLPDNTHRIVASSPTGQVLNAIDVPRMPVHIDGQKSWAAGALYNGRWGAIVTRDLRWLSVGGSLTTDRDGGFTPWAVVMLRF
jgi:hypothetical protein